MKKHKGSAMKKTLREITTELQTQCHEGESERKLKIKILDAYYDIGEIKKVVAGNEVYFIIEAEV